MNDLLASLLVAVLAFLAGHGLRRARDLREIDRLKFELGILRHSLANCQQALAAAKAAPPDA